MNNHLEAKLGLLNTQIDTQLEANQRGIAKAEELLDLKDKLLSALSQIERPPVVSDFDLIVNAIEGNEAVMFGNYRLRYDKGVIHYYQHPMRVASEYNPMIAVDPYDYAEIIASNTIILLEYL